MKPLSKSFAVLAILVTVVAAAVGAARAAEYHVAPSGFDGNSGAAERPWRTLSKASRSAVAGDRVVVHGGIYEEFLVLSRSGTASKWIEYVAAPGETPVIDGAGLTMTGVRRGVVTFGGTVSYIRVSGFEIRNLSNSRSSRYDPIGIAILESAHHLEVLNCKIHGITSTLEERTPKGVLIEGDAHHILIQGGSVSGIRTFAKFGNAHAIAVFGTRTVPVDAVTVRGVEIHDLLLGESESLVFNGNVTNFKAIGNIIHDCDNIGIDVIGFEGVGPTGLDQARDGHLVGNRVYNISTLRNPAYQVYSAGGIYVDGGRDILIERNEVFSCDLGIELASESPGGVTSGITVRDNLVWRNSIGGILLGGYEVGRGATEDCLITNNTFYENDTRRTQIGEVNIRYRTNRNRFTNNVFKAGPQGWFVTFPAEFSASEGNVFASNCHYTASRTSGWEWKGRWASTWSAFRRISGQEDSGLLADPLFLGDATDHGLRPQPASPLIDRGLEEPESDARLDLLGRRRISGAGIDIGAYEFGSVSPVLQIDRLFVREGAIVTRFSNLSSLLDLPVYVQFSTDGANWATVARRRPEEGAWVWATGLNVLEIDGAVEVIDWRGLRNGLYRSAVGP